MESQINESFKNSISSEAIKDITLETAEQIIDNQLAEGVVKDLPIAKYFYNGYKITKSVREYFLLQKIFKFLRELNSVDLEKRKLFVEKLDKDKEHRDRVIFNLLITIEKTEEINKVSIFSNLFSALIEEKITRDDFFRGIHITSRSHYGDLIYLKATHPHDEKLYESISHMNSSMVKQNLFSLGLLKQKVKDNDYFLKKGYEREIRYDIIYELNVFGELYLKYGFK